MLGLGVRQSVRSSTQAGTVGSVQHLGVASVERLQVQYGADRWRHHSLPGPSTLRGQVESGEGSLIDQVKASVLHQEADRPKMYVKSRPDWIGIAWITHHADPRHVLEENGFFPPPTANPTNYGIYRHEIRYLRARTSNPRLNEIQTKKLSSKSNPNHPCPGLFFLSFSLGRNYLGPTPCFFFTWV
jgi:hypothetical protein